jgi:hypothetical protein
LVGRITRVAFGTLILLWAGACGLTADFSGLQGGTLDGGGGDASIPPPGRDGGAEGSGHPGDGGDGPPATGEGGAGDAGFCASLATQPRFCDDFDEGQDVGAGWSASDVYPGSSVVLDYTYYSPPASFLGSIQASSTPASARLQEDLPLDTPHVHMEFEALLPQLSGNFNFEVCALHQPVGDGTTYGVFYKYSDGNLNVYVRTRDDDGGESDYMGTIGPPPSGWLHVEIDTDVSPSATIVVKHQGVVVLNAPNVDTLTSTRASMFVELGYYSADPATAIAHFDNVVIDWQ